MTLGLPLLFHSQAIGVGMLRSCVCMQPPLSPQKPQSPRSESSPRQPQPNSLVLKQVRTIPGSVTTLAVMTTTP